MKIMIMQVPDTTTEDDIHIAIELWNQQHPDRKIEVKMQTSFYAVKDQP